MKNFYSKIKTLTQTFLIAGASLLGFAANAQTTLAAGDIAFTSYDSSPLTGVGDKFSFVLLTNISAGTTISFTDRGYNGSGWQAAGTSESAITWVSGTAIPMGTEVHIVGLVSSTYNPVTSISTPNGTVTLTDGSSTNGLSLANTGDQIIAFQGGSGAITGSGAYCIAGINYLYYPGGGTTTAGWNVGVPTGPNSSLMPPGLIGGTSAFYTGAQSGNIVAQSGKFNCTGTPTSTAASVRSAVMTMGNWSLLASAGTTAYSGCQFIGSNPVITGNPPNRTLCSGGNTTFSITATGATSYQWQQNTGSGFVAIPNGAPFSGVTTTTLTITGVTGTMSGYQYRCVATNSSGSATSNSATLTVSSISASTSKTNVSCNGGTNGTATVTASGGIGPYTYSWSPSGGTAATATGLAAGNYTVTITDLIGCTTTATATITQPTAISGTTVVTNIACNGGSTGAINLTPTGGSAPYTFNWGGGITTEDRTGLAAGTYTVTITDANGCTGTVTATVTQPTAMSATVSQTNVSCNSGSNGTAGIVVTGGTAPYTYAWSPSGGTAATATGLLAGTYTVTVTDANACTITRTVTITQPTAISGTTVVTNIACNGGSTGAINLTPTGGSAPYTFNWGGGITTEDRTGLSAGTYTVTITDANGCTGTVTATVTQPTAMSATVSQTNVSCNNGSNGTAGIVVTGGTAPYTYAWSPSGGTAATATGLLAGTYTVTVTDANACTLTRTVTITQPTAISGTTVVTNIACNGGSTGAINLTPTGGSAPYTFNWGGGITTEDRTGLAAGTYTVTITDANGCTGTVTAMVTQPASAVSGTTVVTNIACNGGSTGAINLTPTGGSAPYTFNWGGGITTEDRTGLAAGTYTVAITDANGCTGTVTATVTQPTAMSATVSQTNVSCNSGSNGTAGIVVTGGTAPYTYAWSPSGGTAATATGLLAGTYTVTVTDANACTITRTVTITQPTAISATTVVTNIACNGGSTGAINLTPTGGSAPYTFNWGGGITTEDRTGLAAGTYTVTITDANGCTGTVTATVTQPASAVSGTTVVTNIACNGGSTGAINLTPTGGSAPYTFNWGGGITTEDRTGLAAGTYTVTITDANGCTGTVTATVTQPASAVSGTTVVTNIACNGGSTGAINLTPTGGSAPYTFNWGGGITTEDRTGLAAGTYTITITDANGCSGTVTATVTQPTAMSATVSQTNVSCNSGSNGTAGIVVTGGTAPYTYAWSPSGGTAATATGLLAGTYTVTVTDANACTLTRTVTITQPTAISGTTVVTNIACNGGSTGAINLTPTGGSAPYTFNWGGGITTEDRTGLSAGTYTVTITDSNGCTGTVTATVTQPTAMSATTSQTNISCNGGTNGTASIVVTGGTAPYTYSWSPSGGTAATATGLLAGTYTVTVTDANACTLTRTVTITQPTAISGTTVVTNIACNGGSTGAINLTPTGGSAPYTFNWGGGITTEDRTGLAAGTYTVTITDANGCTGTVSATVTQPTAMSATVSQTNVSCNSGSNGTAGIVVTGGTAPYTYSWSPSGGTVATATGLLAGTYTVTVTDANACTITRTVTITQPTAISGTTVVTNIACNGGTTGAINLTPTGGSAPYTFNWGGGITTEDRTGLAAGSYTVTITDANGCTGTVSATVTQPTAMSATVSQTNVSCNSGSNGTAGIVVTGGTAPYTYSWSPSGGTAATATGLSAGTYTVTVTDANACTITRTVTITQPTAISGTTVVTNIACNGGSTGAINLTPTGGSAPYTFNWGGGITTEDRTGLSAGTYTVTITDANGCTGTVSATVTQPTAISGTTVVTNIACNGGSTGAINLTPTGGSAPYTFNWGGGITTEDRTGLAAGTYTVIITDANGCTGTVTATVTQTASAVSGTTVVTNIACNGGSTGAINLTPTGGSAPYTFNWGGGITTEDRTGLAAGTYTVTITDANGCTGTVTATVTQPTAMSATVSQTNVSCNSGSNGTAGIVVTGGTAPYTYSWSPSGGTAATATGLLAGTYTVTITDANACTITRTVTITQPTAISGTTVVTNIACNGGSTGTINLTPTGGSAPYTFNWGGGITTEDRTGLSAGTYTVTITDSNGCTGTVTATVTQPTAMSATVSQTNVSCNSGSNGTAGIVVTGGTAPYTYSWSPSGGTAATATGLLAGTYTVTVTDANACTLTRTVTITQPTAISGTTVVTNIACNGGSTGAINLTPTGGSAPYTFNWGGGITTEDRTGLAAGTYTVTITDANGCTGTVTATVTQPTAMSATVSQTNVSCNSGSNGTAGIVVTGGTAPYTYSWSPSGGTAATATGLLAGTYTVTVTDANACTLTRTVTITQPTAISGTTVVTNIACNGGSTGAINLTPTGGSAPYTFNWGGGITTEDRTGLSAGTYTVTITDANGCTGTVTATVTQSSAVAAPTGAATQSFNAGDTLSALVVAGQNIKWYASATDAANHTGSLPTTTVIVNNTTYYATQTVGVCESTVSLAVLAYNASLSVGNATKPKSEMQIYPNPVMDILNISGEEKITKLAIYSADGRKVTEKTLSKNERSINVHSLVQGVYLIQVFTKDDVKTFKFIKR
ncbi:T9SS type A sorting domain-containing protein [Chryseobacterium indoltheticum]|uniref:T9SS type A sorting domain-containing protein n=1 Tax=Chryseobacterium indoltheticum TaxID=254 RepID=UPI004041BCA5